MQSLSVQLAKEEDMYVDVALKLLKKQFKWAIVKRQADLWFYLRMYKLSLSDIKDVRLDQKLDKQIYDFIFRM